MIEEQSNIFKSNRFIIFAIILILLIVYFRTFFHGLIFLDDDTLIFTKFKGMGLGEKISFSFTSNYLDTHYYRPIALLSIIGDSVIAGNSYFIYHFTNFIIHLLTCILIFASLKELGTSTIYSFLTVLIFSLTPLHINAVGWIAGRGDLLAGLFSAAALLIFIKFIKLDKLVLLIPVSVLLFLAFLSKEVALLVPFLFVVFYFVEKKNYLLNKSSVAVLMMLLIVLSSYYLLRGLILTGVHVDKFSFTTYYKNVLVLPETISKFFIPAGIRALPGIETFTSVAGSILLFFVLFLPLVFKRINRGRYYFGLLWLIMLLIPGMVIRTMGQDGFFYWDCRSYLPAIGFAFMISTLLNAIIPQKYYKPYYAVIMIYLLILGTSTFIQMKLYESPTTFWGSVKADNPISFLPYVGLYNYYNHIDNPDKAEKQLLLAIEIRPKEISIRNDLVNFYIKQNSFKKAKDFLRDTLIKEKIFSDYLLQTYLDIIPGSILSEEVENLLKTYKDDSTILEKIRKVSPAV